MAVLAAVLVPLRFASGDMPTGALALATAALLLAGYRMSDVERRNEIALAIVVYLNLAVLVTSASLQASLGPPHLVLLCMAFVLIERDRVVMQWIAVAPSLVLLTLEPMLWPSNPSSSWGAVGGAVVLLASGVGTLGMMMWITRMRGDVEDGSPAPVATERGPGPEPRSGEPKDASAPVESKGRALVVDDNPINLKVALRNLAKLGCEVLTAADGREAVALVQEHDLDVVFMDIQMPVMDGFEATRTIRAGEKGTGKRLPIVAMTAHSMAGYRELCVRAGMDGYITKPLRMTDMARTLSRWIGISWESEGEEDPGDAPRAANSWEASTPSARIRRQPTSVSVLGELDAPMLDKVQLEEATDGDSELARELLGMLFDTGTKSFEQASRALARGDQDEARRAIHSIKGAAATLGAARLAQACKRVEGLRPEQLGRGLVEARAEFSALRESNG